jgi:hypothetical protein
MKFVRIFTVAVIISLASLTTTMVGASAQTKTTVQDHSLTRVDSNPRPWYYVIQQAGPVVFAKFTCVIFHESRSTWADPNLGDNNKYGSSGIFQIEDATWLRRSGFTFHVWLATPREQAIGALHIEQADTFQPWTTSVFC